MGTLAKHDIPQFYLLVVLYCLQGICCGLSYGTLPFLLKTLVRGSNFTQVGIFSMSTYPYSLKILWSPLVDSWYSPKHGRRRSWIIPVQYIIGVAFIVLGSSGILVRLFPELDPSLSPGVGSTGATSSIDLPKLTFVFCFLIFLCATQDIAVDGWALEILSEESLSFASTAQTVGLNIGYFSSFTVFLTFNSPDFVNKYFRSTPQNYGWVSLPQYLNFCGVLYLAVTTYVLCYTREKMLASAGMRVLKQEEDIELATPMLNQQITTEYDTPLAAAGGQKKPAHHSLQHVYTSFLKIIRLPNVQLLCAIHLVAKFAFQCNDGATQLKLLDKGFKREDLAITVLIYFPFEILFGYYVGKLSSADNSNNTLYSHGQSKNFLVRVVFGELGVLTPFLFGFLGKLGAAALGSCVVWMYPDNQGTGELPLWYFLLVIVHNLLGSFMSTIQFVSICAFHTRIADPMIGGTYMTLLNTISNLGGTWPKIMILQMIDKLTVRAPSCLGCKDLVIVEDGYYTTNALCITVGLLLYFGFIKKNMNYLQKQGKYTWRSAP